jgi:hypothetical protein
MHARPHGSCAALLAIVAIGAGCGASKSAVPAPRLTQAAFVAKANALCRAFDRQSKGLERRLRALGRRRDLEGTSLALGEAIPSFRSAIYRLSRLRPPLRKEHTFRELIRLLNKDLAYLRGAYKTLGTYDLESFLVLVRRAERVERRVQATARSLGLRACAA